MTEPYGHVRFDRSIGLDWDTVPSRTGSHGELKSGRLLLRLETVTPLVLFGSSQQVNATHTARGGTWVNEVQAGAHTEVTLPADKSISGSTIRGIARTWFEIITGSARLMEPEAFSWRRAGVDWREGLLAGILRAHQGKVTLLPCNPVLIAVPPAPVGAGARTYAVRNKVEFERRLTGHGFGWNPLKNGTKNNQNDKWLAVSSSAGRNPEVSVAVFTPGGGQEFPLADETLDRIRSSYGHLAGEEDPQTVSGRWPTGNNDPVQFVKPTGRDLFRMVTGHRQAPSELPVWYEQTPDGLVSYLSHVKGGRTAHASPLEGRVADGRPWARLETMPDDRLSPADAVFGPAQPGTTTGSSKVRPPLKSRVRTLSAKLDPEYVNEVIVAQYHLDVLEQPKPSSAGLYLDGPGEYLDWGDPGIRVAGTKMYYHQPNRSVAGQRRYNASTVQAVEPGAKYLVDILFEDLTPPELGALLLACTLQFAPSSEPCGWKVGLAKPLGYGTVSNTLVDLVLIDKEAEIQDPFQPHEFRLDDWDFFFKAAIAEYEMYQELFEDCCAVAYHDTVWRRPPSYTPMGEIRRNREGRSEKQLRPADQLRAP